MILSDKDTKIKELETNIKNITIKFENLKKSQIVNLVDTDNDKSYEKNTKKRK